MKKTKKARSISNEDKQLIRETVNNLSVLKSTLNHNTNKEEMATHIRRGRDGSASAEARDEIRVNAAVWKTLAVVFAGILMLFATDIIEFKKYAPKEEHVMKTSNPEAEPETRSEIIGGIVQTKAKKTESPTKNPTANPTAKATEPPTENPTANPTAKATEPPTENPTANPTAKITEPPMESSVQNPIENLLPDTGGIPVEEDVFSASRKTYLMRGKPISDEARKAMEEKWGKWTLEPDNKDRPKDDYYAAYPHRDIPRSQFPPNAWQLDKEWLSKFLPEGIKLVDRAREAILEEYGQPNDGTSELFHFERHEAWMPQMENQHCKDQGGCTTVKSMDNLKRRLLHAIMTEDIFVFAMGGHSSSAGHGNHFTQSYTLQVQWILEGLFSRLGVRHQSRNFGLGGLGTTQSGLATKQIFGHDIDILMWDSGMTEKEPEARDLFFRQGILGAGKVPMLISASPRNDVLGLLNEHVDADVLMLGEQNVLQNMETLEEVGKLPWALQYVRCGAEIANICRDNEYAGECWIERDDVVPLTKQQNPMGGRAKWHPGNRKHQVTGRVLAMMILEALKEALVMWNEAPSYQLPDDAWHVTNLYENTRSKLESLDPEIGFCKKYLDNFSRFMCNHPVKARLEFTPRSYPDFTNIRTLMPPSQAELINDPPENLYEAPDVFNKDLHPPEGALDVLNIIEAGLPYTPVLVPDYTTNYYPKPKFQTTPSVPVGKGFYLNTYAGFCDGSVDSWCKRQASAECLLYGHNDGRNGIYMDSYCGWMVTNLPGLKHGFIAVKIETWHQPKTNPKTRDWNSINNEGRKLEESNHGPYLRFVPSAPSSSNHSIVYDIDDDYNLVAEDGRKLKPKVPDYCPEFRFEFVIDGKSTSWNKDEFIANTGHIQRVVEVMKIAEDPSITGGVEKEVEFAFRLTGCANEKTMQLTHIYWA